MTAEPEGVKAYELSRLYRAEAATVLRLAKILRLGPRHDRTKPKLVPTGPRPWEGYEVEPSATIRGGFAKELAEIEAKTKAKQSKPESDDGSPPAA